MSITKLIAELDSAADTLALIGNYGSEVVNYRDICTQLAKRLHDLEKSLTEQVRAQDKWISGLTQPDNCLPVYAVKNFTMRFKEYKPSSQQAKRGIIGRWQEYDGYGWTNCEPPEKYSTTPPKEAE